MHPLNTIAEFDETLELARRLARVRTAIEDLEQQRSLLYKADFVSSWHGPARGTFDDHWTATDWAALGRGRSGENCAESQLLAHEFQLVDLWVKSVERHNDYTYQSALDKAAGLIEQNRADDNLAEQFGDAVDVFNWFTQEPHDLVQQPSGSILPPSEPTYDGGAVFAHYERYGNYWAIVWKTQPSDILLYCEAP